MVVILGKKNLNPTFSVFLFVTRHLNSIIFVDDFVECRNEVSHVLLLSGPRECEGIFYRTTDYCSHEDLCSKRRKRTSKRPTHLNDLGWQNLETQRLINKAVMVYNL